MGWKQLLPTPCPLPCSEHFGFSSELWLRRLVCFLDPCLEHSWLSSSASVFPSGVPIWEVVVFSQARWPTRCSLDAFLLQVVWSLFFHFILNLGVPGLSCNMWGLSCDL